MLKSFIHDDLICFRNKISAKNFGSESGLEFAIFFDGDSSYFAFKDGNFRLAKKSAKKDRLLFEADVKRPNGELYCLKYKDIEWNILDFS